MRTYDPLGRVKFVADPYIEDDSYPPYSKYGTTYTYNTDGTPQCSIRGTGVQPQTNVTAGSDWPGAGWPYQTIEASEVYPTCQRYFFANNTAIVQTREADSMLHTPQGRMVTQNTYTAAGRLRETNIFDTCCEASPYAKSTFGYDFLGRMTRMSRHGAIPVTVLRHYNSLGWMTKLEEPGVAPRSSTFDSWGNVTKVQWCDDLTPAPCSSADRRNIARYDARNRLTHREDQAAGQTVPGTVYDYHYDV